MTKSSAKMQNPYTPSTPENENSQIRKSTEYTRTITYPEFSSPSDNPRMEFRRDSTLSLITEPSPKKTLKSLNVNKHFMELVAKTSLRMKRRFKSIDNTEEEVKEEKSRISQLVINYFDKEQYLKGRGHERKRSVLSGSTSFYSMQQSQINNSRLQPQNVVENKSVTLTTETLPTPKTNKRKSNIIEKLKKMKTTQDLSKFKIKTRIMKTRQPHPLLKQGSVGISHRYSRTCGIHINLMNK
ncbi:unnamed protein product [Blepharisma stoltei]|uniref:Uncharacterized protein n=1 Tax=Blepharisma stoltei TaxID=1481888 RepID=A0AAU9JCW8_9CILI|nr:unnamed protein product [Blepharisma stoltei]